MNKSLGSEFWEIIIRNKPTKFTEVILEQLGYNKLLGPKFWNAVIDNPNISLKIIPTGGMCENHLLKSEFWMRILDENMRINDASIYGGDVIYELYIICMCSNYSLGPEFWDRILVNYSPNTTSRICWETLYHNPLLSVEWFYDNQSYIYMYRYQ
jgi:hypothetical protein